MAQILLPSANAPQQTPGISFLLPSPWHWVEPLFHHSSPSLELGLIGLTLVLGGLALNRTYTHTRSIQAVFRHPSFYWIITVTGILTAFILVHQWYNQLPRAQLKKPQIARSGPASHYLELKRLKKGQTVRLLGRQKKNDKIVWRQIQYGPEGVGWLPAQALIIEAKNSNAKKEQE